MLLTEVNIGDRILNLTAMLLLGRRCTRPKNQVYNQLFLEYISVQLISQSYKRLINIKGYSLNILQLELCIHTVDSKKKKKVQHESCALSFIWGKMRTAAQETAFQIAPRNCSKEVGGKVSIYVILVKGEYMQSSTYFFAEGFCQSQGTVVTMKDFSIFLDMRRYKNWAHKIGT